MNQRELGQATNPVLSRLLYPQIMLISADYRRVLASKIRKSMVTCAIGGSPFRFRALDVSGLYGMIIK